MQFLYPGFLWALLALAVPIILHLFYFRRYKKVYFSNVKFLREVKEETSARNKLRNLLILLARCLAIAALVLAFAQPYIATKASSEQGQKTVSVYVDNSFSMQAFGDDLPLLDKARQRARETFLAYSETDRFQLLTNDLGPSEMRLLTREEALAAIEEIDISPAVVPLSRVVSRQERSTDDSDRESVRSYLISDFQRSTTDLQGVDTVVDVTLVPVESVQKNNIGIDSAWFEQPVHLVQQTSRIIVRITNYSADQVQNIKLTSTVDGQEKPVSTFDIDAGETLYDTVSVTVLRPGWHEVTVRITDFPVQFDDTYLMTFYVKEMVKVLAIHDGGVDRRLSAVFENNALFELETQSAAQLNYSEFRNYDLIVVDEVPSFSTGLTEALYSYLEAGGNLMFFPSADANVESYNGFLTRSGVNTFGEYETADRRVGSINTEAAIFRNVYIETNRNLRLPSVRAGYRVQTIQSRGGERLLSYRDGGAFLVQYAVNRGNLIVSNAPLNEEVNELSRNAELFVPLMYNAAVITNKQAIPAYTIGKATNIEVVLPVSSDDRSLRFEGPSQFIPRILPLGARTLVDPEDQITESGFYRLYSQDDLIGVYGFNYDREESDLSGISPAELAEKYGSQFNILESSSLTAYASAVSQQEHGITLWRWCIIFALAFIGLEIFLIRAWKT